MKLPQGLSVSSPSTSVPLVCKLKKSLNGLSRLLGSGMPNFLRISILEVTLIPSMTIPYLSRAIPDIWFFW